MKGLIAGFTICNQPGLANTLADMGYIVMYREIFFGSDGKPRELYNTATLNGLTEKQAWDYGYSFYYDRHHASTKTANKAHYIKLVNECGWHSMDYAFWLGAMAAAEKDNRKLAIFGDSSGTPKTARFDNGVEEWAARIPALRHAAANGHVVTLNQYGRTNPDGSDANYPVSDGTGYQYFGGRHEEFYSIVPPDCRPYIIIGETGASNSRVNQPFAVQDAIGYSRTLVTRPFGDRILFFSLYQLGKSFEWANLVAQMPLAEQLLKDYRNFA